MIRTALAADSAAVVRLLKDSREAAGFDAATGLTGFTFPFSPPHADMLFRQHVAGADRLCLVLDLVHVLGVLMASAAEHPFGPVRFASETVWWIDPRARGGWAPRMLDEYERWAKRRGCEFAGMAGMGEDPDVARLYLRRGYQVAERHFLKAL